MGFLSLCYLVKWPKLLTISGVNQAHIGPNKVRVQLLAPATMSIDIEPHMYNLGFQDGQFPFQEDLTSVLSNAQQ